jgi:hypothetical protein
LVTLYSDHVRLSKPQAGCNHLCFKDYLPPLLPRFCLVAVIGHLSDRYDFQSLSQGLSGILGDWSKGHNAVKDRRQIVVLVGLPVEAPAVDGNIKADDSPAVG